MDVVRTRTRLSCRIWGSHCNGYYIVWGIMSCSPLKVNQHFGGTYRLHLQGRRIRQARNQRESRCFASLPPAFTLVSSSAHCSTLKMEAICSSEKSVDFQQTTWHYIPEHSTLQNYHGLGQNKRFSYELVNCTHMARLRASDSFTLSLGLILLIVRYSSLCCDRKSSSSSEWNSA
jgi:hypothetical protein